MPRLDDELRERGAAVLAGHVGRLVDERPEDARHCRVRNDPARERAEADAERVLAGVDREDHGLAVHAVREQALDGEQQVLDAVDGEPRMLRPETPTGVKAVEIPWLHRGYTNPSERESGL